MLGPVLEGTKVRLEPPSLEHMAAWIRWRADERVTRYLVFRNPRTLREQTEWLEAAAKDQSAVFWSILLSESGQHVGGASPEKNDWGRPPAEGGLGAAGEPAAGKGKRAGGWGPA